MAQYNSEYEVFLERYAERSRKLNKVILKGNNPFFKQKKESS
jgi:hypothetical protein